MLQIFASVFSAFGFVDPIVVNTIEAISDNAAIAIVPGVFFGVWIRTLFIRFVATARYARQGFMEIPKNFARSLFVVDLHHPAELIPEYSGELQFITSRNFLKKAQDTFDGSEGIVAPILFVFFFVPAYLYRLSIKSTCWIYLPLVYITTKIERNDTITIERKTELIEQKSKSISKNLKREKRYSPRDLIHLLETRKEWARRILAVLTFGGLLLATLLYDPQKIQELTGWKFISPLEYVFLIDLWRLAPWQIFNLTSASITVYLFFAIDNIRSAERKENSELTKRIVKRIDWLMWLRNCSSAVFIFIIFGHALLKFSPIMKGMPVPILEVFSLIYGRFMPAFPT